MHDMIGTLQRSLKAAGVHFVRILWCDNANIIRAKASHIDHRPGLEHGVGLSMAQQAIPVIADAVVAETGLSPVGEVQLVPDWSTLRVLPYCHGQALVLGDMKVAQQAWQHCPRDLLRQQCAALAAEGLELRAAFENEFFLLQRSSEGLLPVEQSAYAMTQAMNSGAPFIHALSDALIEQGLPVEYYYPESAPGQQELSIAYSDAMAAADRQIIFRETVRGVAQQHGLVASFMPKMQDNAAGSGCHINLSLWRDGRNISGDSGQADGLSAEARAFMAGMLQHLPGLCALSLASSNSYRRIKPHFWAGAYRSWGYDNREASIRVSRSSGAASRFELKTADATANPYLVLAALMAAGIDGVQQGLTLPEEVRCDPGYLSEAERQARDIHLLPANLAEALDALEADSVLMRALGAERARAYLAVKRNEYQAMRDYSLEEEVALLAERY